MARTRCTPGWWSLACLLLGFSGAACSRGSSESERASGREAPNASAAASAATPASDSKLRARERARARAMSAPPAATPSLPPQIVACVGRSFYRLTPNSLQAFEASAKIPPPEIRGSATARQLSEVEISEPLNLITLGPKQESVLVIAKREVFQYEPGQKLARAKPPIGTPGPLVAWADPRSAGSFWVRVLGERSVHQYSVALGASSDRTRPLPGFDGRLFTVLADGVPLYSNPEGLVRLSAASRIAAFPHSAEPATLVFADSSRERYWTADALGNLSLWDRKQGESPRFTARVPGVVIDAAQEGDRVAVLSMELRGQSYQPSLTVFSKGEQQGQLGVGPTLAHLGQPKLDLCLIAGRPWVVVGGKDWMQLLDWTSRRLLAEW